MSNVIYDIIVIGAGSGGLSVSLFMNKVGLKVLLIDRSDRNIGGDCLNFGCVPSKALIHVSRVLNKAKNAEKFGIETKGTADIQKIMAYINSRQQVIRKHENAAYFQKMGIDVVLGEASFVSANEISVNSRNYKARKIVLANGSRPKKLKVPGVEKVHYFDNENIFDIDWLPKQLLVIGGGPIGMEIGQAFKRLGSEVTIVHKEAHILTHDNKTLTNIIFEQLKQEGIRFMLNSEVDHFISEEEALVKTRGREMTYIHFDAVFVGIGRELSLEKLQLEKAGIHTKSGKIIVDHHLQTTNKNVFVCGDVAGFLKFSHAAEHHARILLNNFFSPFKKRLRNNFMSWVTFTDPELATFGLNENQLKDKNISFRELTFYFKHDDRAVIDNYTYGRLILYISKSNILKKEKILGGAMIAPHAGELIQELILANTTGLSINAIFNKIYPYPVASRVNQELIVKYKEKKLTTPLKKLLQISYHLFN